MWILVEDFKTEKRIDRRPSLVRNSRDFTRAFRDYHQGKALAYRHFRRDIARTNSSVRKRIIEGPVATENVISSSPILRMCFVFNT